MLAGSRYVPLSRGQRLLASSGLERGFYYHELKFRTAPVVQELLRAWRHLLLRHSVLRTVLDYQTFSQRTLLPEDVPIPETFGSIPATEVMDLHSLDVVMERASNRMREVPPHRLLVRAGPTTQTTVMLLMSYALVDRWSVRHLAAELAAMYEALVRGRDPRSVLSSTARRDFHDDLLSKPNKGEKPTDKKLVLKPLAVEGLVYNAQGDAVPARLRPSKKVAIKLPPKLSRAVGVLATKAKVSPASVALSAVALTLWEYSPQGRKEGVGLVVDLDRLVGKSRPVGPVSVPFGLKIEAPVAYKGASKLIGKIHSAVETSLAALQVAQNGPLPTLDEALPCFAYREPVGPSNSTVTTMASGVRGATKAQAPLTVTLLVTRGGDGAGNGHLLEVTVSDSYDMKDVAGFADRVVANLSDCVSVKGNLSSSVRSSDGSAPGRQPGSTGSAAQDTRQGALPYPVVALLQLLGMALMGLVLCLPLFLVWPGLALALRRLGFYPTLALVPVAYHLMGLLMCVQVIHLRNVLIRDSLGVGDIPINSWRYIAWWFNTRLLSLVSRTYTNSLRGTVAYTWWLRWLGATIGEGVTLDGAIITDPELVTLGDGVEVRRATLAGSCVRDGVLHRDRIMLGAGARVGENAVMMPGSRLEDHASLEPLSVATERQVLAAAGVYESAPARFRELRTDISTVAPQVSLLADLLSLFFQAFLPVALATCAAVVGYISASELIATLGFFPWFNHSEFEEGYVIFALFSINGVAPMLGFPTLVAAMKFRVLLAHIPDSILLGMAASLGFPTLTSTQIRAAFATPQGVSFISQYFPAGLSATGSGSDVTLVLTGRLAVDNLLQTEVLPIATQYYVVGFLWMIAVGFLIQGLVLAALTTGVYYVLLILTALVPARRGHKFKSRIRQLKVRTWR